MKQIQPQTFNEACDGQDKIFYPTPFQWEYFESIDMTFRILIMYRTGQCRSVEGAPIAMYYSGRGRENDDKICL